MDHGIGSEDFESRESGEDNSLDFTWGGNIESWEPIVRGFHDPSIQNFENDVPTHPAKVEEVEAWVEVSREKTRQTLTFGLIVLSMTWILIGFIVFLVCGNVWLLAGFGALTMPLTKMCNYYYSHFKHNSTLKGRRIHTARKDGRSRREQ